MHIIEQFNAGLYDSIIASDEKFEALENVKSEAKSEQKPSRK